MAAVQVSCRYSGLKSQGSFLKVRYQCLSARIEDLLLWEGGDIHFMHWAVDIIMDFLFHVSSFAGQPSSQDSLSQ